MKHQHPDDPNLSWCLQCETYKQREEFYEYYKLYKGVKYGPYAMSCCRSCNAINTAEWENKNKEKKRRTNLETWRKCRDIVSDSYVRGVLGQYGIGVTPEAIELKRQQIMMKRTLKEFKKWREENEPNCTDVYGKQRADEVNHERRLQA